MFRRFRLRMETRDEDRPPRSAVEIWQGRRRKRRSVTLVLLLSALSASWFMVPVQSFRTIDPGLVWRVYGSQRRNISFRQRATEAQAAAPPKKEDDDESLLTFAEVEECARAFDLELRLSTLGPGYRVVAKNLRDGEAVGYSSGFLVPPLKIVHLDTMQVRRRYWKQLEGPQRFRFGCGVLLGAAVMCHAYENGCRKAELLAINDDDKTHERLKNFYRLAGFYEVKEVTNEIQCMPDLLVWGGIGTRMDIEVETFLRKWCRMIRSKGSDFGGSLGPSSSPPTANKPTR